MTDVSCWRLCEVRYLRRWKARGLSKEKGRRSGGMKNYIGMPYGRMTLHVFHARFTPHLEANDSFLYVYRN